MFRHFSKTIFVMATIFMLSVLNVASASEKIRLISQYGPGGVFYGALEAISKIDDEKFASRVERMGSCAEIANYARKTEHPMITTWEVQGTFQRGNHPCNLVSGESFVTLIGQAYWNFCRLPESENKNAIHELMGDVRVGVFEGPQYRIIADTLLEGIGSSGVSVPYASVSDYKAALAVGEIDYILTTMDESNMECVLTTNPNSEEIRHSVSDFYTGKFFDASYTVAILGFNVDPEEIRKLFLKASKSDEWKNGVGKRYAPNIIQESSKTQYSFISNYQNEMANVIFSD